MLGDLARDYNYCEGSETLLVLKSRSIMWWGGVLRRAPPTYSGQEVNATWVIGLLGAGFGV